MRLRLIPMDKLTPEQKPLYEDMKKGIKDNFKGFTAINENNQLIGPWNPWLRFPQFGKPVWELTKRCRSRRNYRDPFERSPFSSRAPIFTPHTRSTRTFWQRSFADCQTTRSRPSLRANARAISRRMKGSLTTSLQASFRAAFFPR